MPLSLTPVHSNYFGNTGLVVEIPGELVTDLYGLSTCSLVASCPMNRLDLVPPLFSQHPFFPYLNAEHQRVTIKDAKLFITIDYAGVNGATVPIYELCAGVGEEPIETHPNALAIMGTPDSPVNRALFVDFETGQLSNDPARAVFREFFPYLEDGSLNPFAGISAYLDFSQCVWRQRYYSTAYPSDATSLGRINSPPGPVPALGGSRNWIYMGLTFEQRGIVYGVTREWKASGFRGWNADIYSGGF